jgi:mono/diheme cytochrome c family protein
MTKLAFPILAALALSAQGAAAADQPAATASQIQHGHDVFQYWCGPCHSPGPHHPGTQALALKYGKAEPPTLEDRTDLTPDVTHYYVRHGVSIMPPFRKSEVDDEDLDALAAYLGRPH